MKILSFLFHKILYPACAFFSLIWFVICLIADPILEIVNINLGLTLMCFIMGLMLAISNLILHYRKIPFVGRFFLHMVLTVVTFSVTIAVFSLILNSGYLTLTGRSFYLVLLLIGVYIVIGTPSLLLYNFFVLSKKEKNIKKSEYTPMFKKKDG